MPFLLTIMLSMKWQAILIVLCIVLGLLAPPTAPLIGNHGPCAVLGALDVCHSAMPALSSVGDMPCMNDCSRLHLPLAHSAAAEPVISPLQSTLLVFQDERPPEA